MLAQERTADAIDVSFPENEDLIPLQAQVLAFLPQGISVTTTNGYIRYTNAAEDALFGYASGEMLGRRWSEFCECAAEEIGSVEAEIADHLASNSVWLGELRQQKKDGTLLSTYTRITTLDMSGRRYWVWAQEDLAPLKHADEAVARLAAIVEGSDDAIIGQTLDGIITNWNGGAAKLFGYSAEEAIGQPAAILLLPDYLDELPMMFDRVRHGEHVKPWEAVRRRKDGQQVNASLSISPIRDKAGRIMGISVIARDTSTTRRLEEQMRQAQKMEAIGRLAAGVAHDFNNLLVVMLGYSELSLRSLPVDRPEYEMLREIKHAADRAALLTRQLLVFSRKQVLAPKVLDLNEVVNEMEKLLRRLIGEDVELKLGLDPALRQVHIDPGQLDQVLLNLVVNARDAMPRGGTLKIETSNAYLDESYTQVHAQVQPGRYVLLAVSDTGCGMDEATRARIFEPFFTTKEEGKGTGLGLATVYGIVKQSEGHLGVYSEPGHGTVFKVYLPPVEGITPSVDSQLLLNQRPTGHETILLVEDDQAVRGLARHLLQSCGYNMLEANHGEEALHVCRRYPGKIDLLISDVVMPRMSGRQLADELVRLHPEMKVLFLSGYTDDDMIRHGVAREERAFLQKPFTAGILARKVRDLLDARAT